MNTGELFERKILALCQKGDIVRIEKLHENKNQFGEYLSKMPYDFIGWIVENRQAICFDAKSTKSKTSFSLNLIKEHQIKALKRDVGFILVEFSVLKRYFIVELDEIEKASKKSIKIENLKNEISLMELPQEIKEWILEKY